MMLQPTSGRQGFGYVDDINDDKVESSNKQNCNTKTNNTSNKVNEGQQQQQKPNIIQQTIDAIKKLRK